MGSFALVDVTTHVAGYDMTTDMNQLSMNVSADELEDTTFGSGKFRTRKAGLKDVEADLEGYWQAGTTAVDTESFASLGVADQVVTMGPSAVEGETAYLWRGEKFTYSSFGEIGSLVPFSLNMKGSNGQGLSRGVWLKSKANVAAIGATGTAFQLVGGVASGAALYGNFHVFSAGTTVTAVVESATANTFAGATTRLTFGPITAVGGTMVRLVGPITDTWFRVRVSAITGTFSVACSMGIGV